MVFRSDDVVGDHAVRRRVDLAADLDAAFPSFDALRGRFPPALAARLS